MSYSKSIRGIGLGAVILLTASAAARADQDTATREVSIHGLDLASSGDRAVLRARIDKAARAVCRETNDGEDFSDPGFQSCFETATTDAWAQAEVKIAAAKSRSMVASTASK